MPQFNEFQIEKRKPLSALKRFLLKAVIVVIAIDSIVVFSTTYVRGQYEKATAGQPAFWKGVEEKLYRLADEDDLSPEKKERVLAALKKLSVKYGPYLQALMPDNKPNPL